MIVFQQALFFLVGYRNPMHQTIIAIHPKGPDSYRQNRCREKACNVNDSAIGRNEINNIAKQSNHFLFFCAPVTDGDESDEFA